MSRLASVCLLTFLHYVGAQMRGPVLPLCSAPTALSAVEAEQHSGRAADLVDEDFLGRVLGVLGMCQHPNRDVIDPLLVPADELLQRVMASSTSSRTSTGTLHAIAGVLIASIATALVPQVHSHAALLFLVAVFGAVSGTAGVAIGVALTRATVPAVRGLVMGGYSTALYLGLAVGSLALGPVIARYGYLAGFQTGAAVGAAGAVVATVLWAMAKRDGDPLTESPSRSRST